MLVLTAVDWRRQDAQEIVIRLPDGREIVLSATLPCGDRVRLGIDAPKECRIFRRPIGNKK